MGIVHNPQIRMLSPVENDNETAYSVILMLEVIGTALGRAVLTGHQKPTIGYGEEEKIFRQHS